jgi:hypothetical protein
LLLTKATLKAQCKKNTSALPGKPTRPMLLQMEKVLSGA